MADILVSENIDGPEMDELRQKYDVTFEPDLWESPHRLRDLLPEHRAIIVRNQTQVDSELIDYAERLEVIGRAGAGLENIDTRAAGDAGIVVTYAPNQNSISVAELTLGLMLSLARMIPSANDSTRAGEWQRQRFTGTELFGKTLGVVGLGRIGYLTAARARAFGMDVVAFDPGLAPDALNVTELRARLVDLPELLSLADFVTCHAPDTPQTRGMFDDEAFGLMKPNAFFINAARGKAVDEEALIRALRRGRIAGAALDVRQQEPPKKSPLCEMENVILTPHIAAFTTEGQKRVVSAVCHDIDAVLQGEPAKNCFSFARPARAPAAAEEIAVKTAV